MAQPSSIVKELSSGHGERRIRVLAASPKSSDFHTSTFLESEIQSIDDMGQDLSALVLRSGAVIPVALPYERLEQKIYEPDFRRNGPVLDLRDVPGPPANASSNTSLPCGLDVNIGDRMPNGTVYAGISPTPAEPCTRRRQMSR